MKISKTIICLVLIFCSLVISAQDQATSTLTITGELLDENSVGLPYANVLLLNSDSSLYKGIASDDNGKFEISDILSGHYLLHVQMLGYDNYYQNLELSDSQEIPTIRFESTSAILDEVMVKAQKPLITREVNKTTLNVAETEVYMGEDALEVLRKAPGVIVDQNDNIKLKGRTDVKVLINGKDSYLSNEDISKMLENISSSEIDKIEIIENPSARYDAEGQAGIINIRLSKPEKVGWNANLNSSFSQGSNSIIGKGINLNLRQGKVTANFSYNYKNKGGYDNLKFIRNFTQEDAVSIFEQNLRNNWRFDSHSIRTGIDYNLSKQLNVGLNFKFNAGENSAQSNSITSMENQNALPFNSVHLTGDEDNNWNSKGVNFSTIKKLNSDGHELAFNADYSTYYDGTLNLFNNNYFEDQNEVQGPDENLMSDYFKDIKIKAAKLDYSLPFNASLQLNAGLKYSQVRTENVFDFSRKPEDDWVIDEGRTNSFDYSENISAAYGELNYELKKWSFQVGLRAEHTDWEGYSATLNQESGSQYINLFPSATVAKKFSENLGISASYSRRIGRPDYEELNPFIYYVDQYTFDQGNPYLSPEYTDAFGLTLIVQQTPLLNFGYNITESAITDIIEQDDEFNTTTVTTINYASYKSFSLGTGAPLNFGKWAEGMVQIYAFYNDFKTPLAGEDLDASQLSVYLNVNQNFQLPLDINLNVDAFYQSPMVYGIFELKNNYGVDLAFSKTFLSDKLKVVMGVSDVFHSNKNDIIIEQNNINSYAFQNWDTRKFKLSFKYTLGNNKEISRKNIRNASSAELNRVGGKN